jgi:hypothetical protein
MKKSLLFALGLAAFCAARAEAAYITIDDSDLATVTITAGDFEGGLYIDDVLLTSGLGSSGSATLPDGGYTIAGSWIDLGGAGGARVDLLFAFLADPGMVTSGIEFGVETDGLNGMLFGSFGGFTSAPYFPTFVSTFAQNGHAEAGSVPFLSVSFKSEAVPEPATLLLVGGGVLLALRRRRT